MVRIKFASEIWKAGNSYVVTVPRQYIKDGWLKAGNKHTVEIETTPKSKQQGVQEVVQPVQEQPQQVEDKARPDYV
jgi:antitoxin component of MazEF toxin-antitoxin module